MADLPDTEVQPQIEDDDPREEALLLAIKIAGGTVRLSEQLSLTPASISKWRVVPPERVLQVEAATGVSRYELRGDVFGDGRGSAGSGLLDLEIILGRRLLADVLDVDLEELETWTKVPPELVLQLERLTSVSRHVLRPDVFGVSADSKPLDVDLSALNRQIERRNWRARENDRNRRLRAQRDQSGGDQTDQSESSTTEEPAAVAAG